MLEQKDLEAIAELMNARAVESEKLLLDEMDRLQRNMERKIDNIQKNMEELKTYYRITKLENDNTSLLLQIIDDLRKDVEELKSRIA